MCVILACYDKLPTEQQILKGATENDDGGGVAWITPQGTVRWKKGLTGPEVIKLLKSKGIKPPCLIHFRVASSGEVTKELTHPFPLTPGAECDLEGEVPGDQGVLMHNGTFHIWKSMLRDAVERSGGRLRLPDGPWNDTRALAWMAGNFGQGYLSLLDLPPNKVAVLRAGKLILCYNDGMWVKTYDGFWASNDSFENGRKTSSSTSFHSGSSISPTSSAAPSPKGKTTPLVEDVDDTSGDGWGPKEVKEYLNEVKNNLLVAGVKVVL